MLDGQTVKTKNLYEAISDLYGEKNIKIIDTYNVKFRFPIVLILIIRAFLSCESVIMLPAHNGIKIFAPFFYILKKIFRKKTYYCVIGGWLPSFLADKPRLCDSLKSFDGIFVEKNTMKSALCEYEFENVIVLPNFKKLQIIDPSDITVDSAFPLRLCTFSRVMKEKGIEDAVEAVKITNDQLGKVAYSLDIYGQVDPGYQDRFNSLIEDFPSFVRYKGCVPFDDSTNVLSSYYALLFPTYYSGEGFAGTLLDSYASALPVIASDWKYNPELVSSDVGFLFPAGDIDALCGLLIDIYKTNIDLKKMKYNCIAKAHLYSFDNAKSILSSIIG